MSEQSDWIADQETIAISKEIERFIVRATGKNTTLMMSKIGGNISLNEHLTIQRTLQVAKACLDIKSTTNGSEETPQLIITILKAEEIAIE